jgi:glycosyltransferase involved in cell wall biosynthesis
VVYSCHDLESNLSRLRRLLKEEPAITFKMRAYWWLTDWLENRLFKKVHRVIEVSASEAKQVRERWRIPVEYVPIVPDTAPAEPVPDLHPAIRYCFYGSGGTTSNKFILDHLSRELYELLKQAAPQAEFHQAGNYKNFRPDKIEWLRQHFTLHGFVDDPAKLFHPGDFCLIPYQYDTGFRTKIPEVCGYGMICAGYPVSFACCPEMRDGYNCVIGETPAELAEKMARVAGDSALHARLAAGALETRRTAFSAETLLEKYRRILDF